jgi:hypothetical protein
LVVPWIYAVDRGASGPIDAHGLRAVPAEDFFHTDWNHIGGHGSALRGLAILLRLASGRNPKRCGLDGGMNPQYEGGAIAVANATARFEKVVKRISEFCTITRTPPEIREVSCSTES